MFHAVENAEIFHDFCEECPYKKTVLRVERDWNEGRSWLVSSCELYKVCDWVSTKVSEKVNEKMKEKGSGCGEQASDK